MTDAAASTDATTTSTTDSGTDQGASTDTDDIATLKAELDKWKSQARKHEDRAKANSTAAKELEEVKRQAMSDQEKAVADAKALGRSEAMAEMAGQLVDASIKAQVGDRMDARRLDAVLAGLNRTAFLNEDGSLNTEAITAFVDGIAPKPEDNGQSQSATNAFFPDLGQGARGNAMALNGDPLLKSVMNAVGMR